MGRSIDQKKEHVFPLSMHTRAFSVVLKSSSFYHPFPTIPLVLQKMIVSIIQKTNANACSETGLFYADPRTVITPSPSSDTKFCALDPQSTDTAGTALLRGSDHSFEDFEYC